MQPDPDRPKTEPAASPIRARQCVHFNRIVGVYLKKIRAAAGYTQTAAARDVEIPQQSLSDYERGKRTIGACTFFHLMNLYNANWMEAQIILENASSKISTDELFKK